MVAGWIHFFESRSFPKCQLKNESKAGHGEKDSVVAGSNRASKRLVATNRYEACVSNHCALRTVVGELKKYYKIVAAGNK